jgi:hypothetical protein
MRASLFITRYSDTLFPECERRQSVSASREWQDSIPGLLYEQVPGDISRSIALQ